MDLLSRTVFHFDHAFTTTTFEPTKALDKRMTTARLEVAKATKMVQSFTQKCSAGSFVDLTLQGFQKKKLDEVCVSLCRLLESDLMKQDTSMQEAFPVETQVTAGLWRLATGNTYLSSGLQFRMGKSTA